MKSEKMFTETVEYQILLKLDQNFEYFADSSHRTLAGIFGTTPVELNNKIMKDADVIKKMCHHIIMSSIGKEEVKIFNIDDISTLTRGLNAVMQQEINRLNVFSLYPQETVKLLDKKEKWIESLKESVYNIINLAKGEEFIYTEPTEVSKVKNKSPKMK